LVFLGPVCGTTEGWLRNLGCGNFAQKQKGFGLLMIDKVKSDVERAPTDGSTSAKLVVNHMEVVIILDAWHGRSDEKEMSEAVLKRFRRMLA
jgi:Ni,Fe-hydrogenase maturation factor